MTTDTALLVSHEILEGAKNFEDLAFVDDPQIPMGDSVTRYLDILMPLKDLAEKGHDMSTTSAQIKDFTESIMLNKSEDKPKDVIVDEATLMEGFRYRQNDTKFPVFKDKQAMKSHEFPIIPIGMLDIWRSDNDDAGGSDFF